jgi:hypothetical protein
MSKVIFEGWMVRYGRRKIGRSFIHMRYFVLEPTLLAYYKKKPEDNQVTVFFSFLFYYDYVNFLVYLEEKTDWNGSIELS